MIEAEPPGPATGSVIMMHGLGADAGDLQPLPPAFGLPAGLHVRYLFPSAPRMPVTINMPAIRKNTSVPDMVVLLLIQVMIRL